MLKKLRSFQKIIIKKISSGRENTLDFQEISKLDGLAPQLDFNRKTVFVELALQLTIKVNRVEYLMNIVE